MESGTAHLVHVFAYELQVPVVCVLVYIWPMTMENYYIWPVTMENYYIWHVTMENY